MAVALYKQKLDFGTKRTSYTPSPDPDDVSYRTGQARKSAVRGLSKSLHEEVVQNMNKTDSGSERVPTALDVVLRKGKSFHSVGRKEETQNEATEGFPLRIELSDEELVEEELQRQGIADEAKRDAAAYLLHSNPGRVLASRASAGAGRKVLFSDHVAATNLNDVPEPTERWDSAEDGELERLDEQAAEYIAELRMAMMRELGLVQEVLEIAKVRPCAKLIYVHHLPNLLL